HLLLVPLFPLSLHDALPISIDGILIGEHALRESLTDDNDGLFALTVQRVEITPGDDGNAERGKESRRDGPQIRARILFAGGMNMAVRGDLQTRTKAACIAPGNSKAEGGLVHPGQPINAANRFLVE